MFGKQAQETGIITVLRGSLRKVHLKTQENLTRGGVRQMLVLQEPPNTSIFRKQATSVTLLISSRSCT